MYISVIPVSHTLDTEPLLYYITEDFSLQISTGSLVEVPIGKNIIPAIVYEKDILPPSHIPIENIRSILHILSSTPLLSGESLDIILALSRKMFVQIHKVLLLFLPKSVLTAIEKTSFIKIKANPWRAKRTGETTIELYHTSRVTPEVVEKYLRDNTLIILPDDIILRTMQKYFSEKWYTFYEGDATLSKRVKSWIEVKNGEKSICFWTRRLLYYNLEHYEQILYIEDSFAREHYQHPLSYKHIDTLYLLSENSDISIHILTSIPTIETLSVLKKFTLHNIHQD